MQVPLFPVFKQKQDIEHEPDQGPLKDDHEVDANRDVSSQSYDSKLPATQESDDSTTIF